MSEGQEIQMVTYSENALALPDPGEFKNKLVAINEFQKVVHANLIPNQDFGVIPGTTKPTLLKPGAEKIAKLLNLADEYEILDRQEDWVKGFFRYLIKCRLRHIGSGLVVSEGLGECNSMESKYRWRETKRVCPICGAEAILKGKGEYGGGWICFQKQGGCGAKWPNGAHEIENQKVGRVENEDIYTQVNTILKISKKRALVDATLSAGRLSNIFTQDVEDVPLPKKTKVAVKPTTGGITEEEPAISPSTETPPKPEISGYVAGAEEIPQDVAPPKVDTETKRATLEQKFLVVCIEKLGLSEADICEQCSVQDVADIFDLRGAWEYLKKNNPQGEVGK